MVSEDRKIWTGNRRAVAQATERYQNDRLGGLLQYAIALYSFRNDADNRKKLLSLRASLMERAGACLEMLKQDNPPVEVANVCDVLSTHLEWMTRQGTLTANEQADVLRKCKELCEATLKLEYGISSHTQALLHLTLARIDIREGNYAGSSLGKAADEAEYIGDPLQRARVFAKLGYLHRKNDWTFADGYYWGIRALFVKGVTHNVRLKCFALLLGYDR